MENNGSLQLTQEGLIKQTEGDRVKSGLQRKIEKFKEENKIARQKKQNERNSKAIMEIEPVFIDSFTELCNWNQDISSQQLATLSKEEMLELNKMMTRRAKQFLMWVKPVSALFFFGPWIFTFAMVYFFNPLWLLSLIPALVISAIVACNYDESVSRKYLKSKRRLLDLRKGENFFPYEQILKLNGKNKENKENKEKEGEKNE